MLVLMLYHRQITMIIIALEYCGIYFVFSMGASFLNYLALIATFFTYFYVLTPLLYWSFAPSVRILGHFLFTYYYLYMLYARYFYLTKFAFNPFFTDSTSTYIWSSSVSAIRTMQSSIASWRVFHHWVFPTVKWEYPWECKWVFLIVKEYASKIKARESLTKLLSKQTAGSRHVLLANEVHPL